ETPSHLPSVSVSPSAEIVEGSSVTLTCSTAKYTWYKENEDSPKASGQIFTITDFRAEHSGNYYCEAQNRRGRQNSTLHLTVVAGSSLRPPRPSEKKRAPLTHLTVCLMCISIIISYPTCIRNLNGHILLTKHRCFSLLDAPKLPSVSVSPSAEIVEGSSVTLTCSSDANPAATYTWFKENVKLRPPIEEQQLVLTSIQSSHSGQYTCRARNSLGSNTSKPISIKVKYGPNLPSTSVSPSGEIKEGSSVTLTCQSNAYPAAKYTWYKKNGNPELQPLSENTSLVFSSIQSSDSGEYYCTAENELGRRTSRSISIDVKCE
uniref:Ig-like domain-containing protein n=1 Tax=Sander lucioperca TaxID=283035 RepID=A0A8C9ZND7_SANLU